MTAPDWNGLPAQPEPVRLDECPPGLFMFGQTLCFRSEYSTETMTGHHQPDAYVVASGEYFWGGATNIFTRNELLVLPVEPITKAELAAREAAAAGAVRAAAVRVARQVPIPDDCGSKEAYGRLAGSLDAAVAIDALPTDPTGALSRALAAEREAGRREFQARPFDTAPTDGTVILAYRPDAGWFTAHYVEEDAHLASPDRPPEGDCYWFSTSGDDLTGDLPTAWQPMPPAPEISAIRARGEGGGV